MSVFSISRTSSQVISDVNGLDWGVGMSLEADVGLVGFWGISNGVLQSKDIHGSVFLTV
jgi:hypothetical protein